MCGVDLSDGDEDGAQALSRKLMADPGYEDAPDDVLPQPHAPSWLGGGGGGGGGDDARGGDGRYAAPPAVRYAPPDVPPSGAAASDGVPATWREGPAAASPEPAAGPSGANLLDDLNALMARVEELEAAGDLDAAARLLSGAVQRR